jgi:hypothetical protein
MHTVHPVYKCILHPECPLGLK